MVVLVVQLRQPQLSLMFIFMLRWEVSEWTDCAAGCRGLKRREVSCVSDEAGRRILVAASLCLGSRPESEVLCSRENCPTWSAGLWSGCSVTCGTGVRHRTVSCRNNTGDLSEDCLGDKPAETKACTSKCSSVPAHSQAAGWQKVEGDNTTVLIRDQYSDDLDQEEEEEEEDADSLKNVIGTNPK